MSKYDSSGLLDFTDKNVVLTGAAAGMGAAAAAQFVEHGASVHAIDMAPIENGDVRAYVCDLRDVSAIAATVAQLPDRVDVLINCAGLPNGGRFDSLDVMSVNWLALRQLTESLLPRMPSRSAVVHVASTAGRMWPDRIGEIRDLLQASDWPAGQKWVIEHPETVGDGYSFSKEVVQYYTLHRSLETMRHDVRMNSICPGVTNTQLVDDFRRGVGDAILDRAAEVAGRFADPSEMAPPLLFLADHASSSYINGVNLNVDHGTGAAHLTGQW